MAYQNQKPYAGTKTASKPAAATGGQSGQKGAGFSGKGTGAAFQKGTGNPPDYDVVIMGEDGKVLKDEKGYSVRCGALWVNEDGTLYIKMDEGSPVRIFARVAKQKAVNE